MTTRNLYANPVPSMAGKPYQPSNGTEGEGFIESFCAKCARDDYYRGGEELRCDILTAAFMFRENDPEYPVEWPEEK